MICSIQATSLILTKQIPFCPNKKTLLHQGQKRFFSGFYRIYIPDHRPPITDHRLPITHHRSPITDYRSPITHHPTPQLLLQSFPVMQLTVICRINIIRYINQFFHKIRCTCYSFSGIYQDRFSIFD
jgi:hypothetical protein